MHASLEIIDTVFSGANIVTMTDNTALKEIFKDTIRKIVFENKEFLHEIRVVALADDAVIYAMDEGKKNSAVDEKNVLQKARMAGGLK
jgi:hypothetical protein